MIPNRRMLATAAVLVAVASRAAAGPLPDSAVPAPGDTAPAAPTSPPLHLATGGHLTTPGGADLTLPPGYFLDEPSWSALDAEIRRLQTDETRLTAENKSMHDTLVGGGWKPPWWAITGALMAGAAAGYELARHL